MVLKSFSIGDTLSLQDHVKKYRKLVVVLHDMFTEFGSIFASFHTTTRVHSIRGATCLPRKDGGIPLSVLPKDTTSKLAGLFSTLSLLCWMPSKEAVNTIF